MSLNSRIQSLEEAATVQAVRDACSHLCACYRLAHFAYGVQIPTSLVRPHLFVISNLPGAWRRQYHAQGYLRIDPVVQHCFRRVTPLLWGDAETLYGHKRETRRFLQDARQHGLRSGICIPLNGARGERAALTLLSGEAPQDNRERLLECLPDLTLLATHVHEAFQRVRRGRPGDPERIGLTRRERECLLWSAEGKTTAETSQILGIVDRTVIYHLQNAADKMNVRTRRQAVVRAVSQALIRPRLL